VDGLSGATVTSRAALEAIDRSVRRVGRVALEREFAPAAASSASPGWRSPGFITVSVLLLLFFPVYLSGNERARLLFQALSLGVPGLWLNSLITEVDWVNLSMGHWPDPVANPLRWLLIGFVAVTALLFGQVWCGYCCPFGALQEFISRLGRWLRLRSYPGRPLDVHARFLKFTLLALMSVAVWLTTDPRWAAFDPMQYLFSLSGPTHIAGWMLLLIGVVLFGALFYYRFWCRYLCPLGALLALSNKLALLQRLAPKRRFNHCDLGVKEEFDIDCIRCNRCISGTDTRLRPP
jgi:polyferredoxin